MNHTKLGLFLSASACFCALSLGLPGAGSAESSATDAAHVGHEKKTFPLATPPAGMTLSALLTGKMMSRAGLAYSGGPLGEKRVFAQGAIVVQHPQGILLFDAGFGSDVDRHFQTVPWLMQQLTSYEKLTPARAQLAQAGIDFKTLKAVVLTHAHWDHVSGLADLPGVPVWLDQDELDFVRSGSDQTLLARQLGLTNYHVYGFANGPYLGFSRSYDVFGDGSVVLVEAPGHTPGSIIAFIATPDGKHYALIGDLAWLGEGVEQVAPKPWFVRRRVDQDPDQTLTMLERIHALKAALPSLIIVPAHDHRVWQTLPKLPPK